MTTLDTDKQGSGWDAIRNYFKSFAVLRDNCRAKKIPYGLITATIPAIMATDPLAAEPSIEYPAVTAQVSFDAVLALPAGSPASRFDYGPHTSQFAELWLPPSERHPSPVVVFVHGGCWLEAYSIDHSHALATALTQEGFAVWNIEYRRVGEPGGGWPGSLADVQAAIAMLKGLEPVGVDLERIHLAGHSAGGHLALLAGKDAPVIGLAPIIDIADYATGTGSCNEAAIAFMGAAPLAIPEAYAAATPALSESATILMGSLDSIVPAQPAYLSARYQAWPAAGHFDWIYPGTPAWTIFIDELRGLQP